MGQEVTGGWKGTGGREGTDGRGWGVEGRGLCIEVYQMMMGFEIWAGIRMAHWFVGLCFWFALAY